MPTETLRYREFHDEVVAALSPLGNARLGLSIQKDRRSELSYLGVRFPALRTRVRQGFSFTALHTDEVLSVWDNLWQCSPYGDVLFAALEHYMPIVRKQAESQLWPVLRHWVDRLDNWCHCDMLSGVYSHFLEQNFEIVYPQLVSWNNAEGLWQRRTSLVSLVHYSGKHAVFLPPDHVLPMALNCLGDSRHYVQTAVGWVLREMGRVYPTDVACFVEEHVTQFSATAFSRTIERLPVESSHHLRALRRG